MASKAPSTKRFGSRYGKTNKNRFGAIEKLQHKKYICPACSRQQVRRLSTGIWQCQKCNHKFTSKAYTVSKTTIIQNKVTEL
ncbi:MAG: 50S ribosomal protein L37ae [Patescibacteria group bacterium]|nr:50S ribosomal protein L37ae [Patescibacteria group bacterium]